MSLKAQMWLLLKSWRWLHNIAVLDYDFFRNPKSCVIDLPKHKKPTMIWWLKKIPLAFVDVQGTRTIMNLDASNDQTECFAELLPQGFKPMTLLLYQFLGSKAVTTRTKGIPCVQGATLNLYRLTLCSHHVRKCQIAMPDIEGILDIRTPISSDPTGNTTCFRSGKEGHKLNKCSKSKKCFECGIVGNLRLNCPRPQKG